MELVYGKIKKKGESNKQQSKSETFQVFQRYFTPLKELKGIEEGSCNVPTAFWTFIGILKLIRNNKEEEFKNLI